MKRIAVIGPVGAGKSRLAAELSQLLGIRVLHLDTLFWKPGWVPTPLEEWEAVQRRELAEPAWIADAQYDDILPDWVEEADTVVFLDVSPLVCLWRVSRRRLDRGGSGATPAGTEPGSVPWSAAEVRPQPVGLPDEGPARAARRAGARAGGTKGRRRAALRRCRGIPALRGLAGSLRGNFSQCGSGYNSGRADPRDDLERERVRRARRGRLGQPRPVAGAAEPVPAPQLAARVVAPLRRGRRAGRPGGVPRGPIGRGPSDVCAAEVRAAIALVRRGRRLVARRRARRGRRSPRSRRRSSSGAPRRATTTRSSRGSPRRAASSRCSGLTA